MHLNLVVFPEAKARVEQEEELWGQHKRHAQKQEGEKDTGGSKVGVLGSESDLLEGVESEGREETGQEGSGRPGKACVPGQELDFHWASRR